MEKEIEKILDRLEVGIDNIGRGLSVGYDKGIKKQEALKLLKSLFRSRAPEMVEIDGDEIKRLFAWWRNEVYSDENENVPEAFEYYLNLPENKNRILKVKESPQNNQRRKGEEKRHISF